MKSKIKFQFFKGINNTLYDIGKRGDMVLGSKNDMINWAQVFYDLWNEISEYSETIDMLLKQWNAILDSLPDYWEESCMNSNSRILSLEGYKVAMDRISLDHGWDLLYGNDPDFLEIALH